MSMIMDRNRIVRYEFLDCRTHEDPPVEIGAVYYRRSNPPREDWERDYARAKADGHTLMRHWFNWCDIHIAPDTFDFSLYDEHLKLAAKYGIKTVIAEMTTQAPDWLYHACPEGRLETADVLEEMKSFGCMPDMKVSFDGTGYHDWMRCCEGAEKAAVRAIELCLEHGFYVTAQINVNRKNGDSMLPTLRMLDRMGVQRVRVIRTSESAGYDPHGQGIL